MAHRKTTIAIFTAHKNHGFKFLAILAALFFFVVVAAADVDFIDEEVFDVVVNLELEWLLELLEEVFVPELVPVVEDAPFEVTPLEGFAVELWSIDPVLTGTVVAPLIITFVVPSITVVIPDIENLGSIGTVVGPVSTNSVVPSMTVKEPGRTVTPG